jgi:hypothetical protein
MREQMMGRYMNAVKELAQKFDNYTNGIALVKDYQRASNEVALQTTELAMDLGLHPKEYEEQALSIMHEAFSAAGEKLTRIEFETKTNQAIANIANLLE